MAEKNDQLPEVTVETLGDKIVVAEQNTLDTNTNEGQLKRPPSATPRNRSPVTIQEWVDSLPSTVSQKEDLDNIESSTLLSNLDADNLTLGAEAGHLSRGRSIPNVTVTSESNIVRTPSEAESQTSSFDSKLLNDRKPDPEEILLGLGFGGGIESTVYGEYGRVPKRFLQPSQLKGVSVEDYLRHQQELIYMYESGLWGYRGLTGPPHASPSVIVAKIMEKLREHECDIVCPKDSSRVMSSTNKSSDLPDKSTKKTSNRFNKVAENILTKIRCTPGSVLTPDNRKWLDSQGGDKSPELSRRLMIGQQSFVLTRDGTLIETPPSSVIADNENSPEMNVKVTKDQVFITSSENPSELDEDNKVIFKVGSSSSMNTDIPFKNNNYSSIITHNDSEIDELKPIFDLSQPYDKDYSPERDLEDLLSIVEPCQDVSKASSEVDSGAASDSADTSCAQINLISLTESEIIENDDLSSKHLFRQYEDLCNLRLRLNVLGCPFNIVPQDQFVSLSAEQRCALQCKILRLALRVYLNKLTDDEVHHELQSCLGAEVQHVADLLDSNSDVDKLAIIVRQMTVLLHHQTHLNSQLAELTVRAQNPTACHDMCELILQRVRGLEQLVEQNANELAIMKAQLSNKKTL